MRCVRVVYWDSLKSESSSRDEPTKLFTGKGVLKKLRTTPELSDNESLPGFVLWSHHSSGNTQDFQCFPPQSNTFLHHSLCSCGVNTDGFCGVTLSNPYLFLSLSVIISVVGVVLKVLVYSTQVLTLNLNY